MPAVNLNLNVRGLHKSATLEINERSNELIAAGEDVYKLGLGQSPFPVPQLVVDSLRQNAHQKDYLPVQGLPQLREAVANYHRLRHDLECSAEDVLVGPGSKELMFLLQLAYYGDLVVPVPSWVSYAPQAYIIGRHISWLPTRLDDDWRLTPEGIEQLCHRDCNRPRIIILNYPNNPTGSTYEADELQELAAMARKYHIIMLSDEIYGEIHHDAEHVSIAKFYPEGTIVSSGLSKWCGAGGWRLGTFTFPRSLQWLRTAMAAVASETYTSTSAPIQYAAVTAFQWGREIEEFLYQSRRILKALGMRVTQQLREVGAQLPKPKGGFYLFPDFTGLQESLLQRGISGSEALCERLLEDTGVAMLPGSAFGCQSQVLTARLAYVDFDGGAALAAARRIPTEDAPDMFFLNTYCDRVITAIQRLCDWLTAETIKTTTIRSKIVKPALETQ